MNSLSAPEIKMLIQLLNELKDEQENAGCNDLILPLTQDNIEFATLLNNAVDEDLKLQIGKKNISGFDIVVTAYFINRLKNMVK